MPSKPWPKKCIIVVVCVILVIILAIPILINYKTWLQTLTSQLPAFAANMLAMPGGVLLCTAFLIALIYLVVTALPRPSKPPSDAFANARFAKTFPWLNFVHYFILPAGLMKMCYNLAMHLRAQQWQSAGIHAGLLMLRFVPILIHFVIPSRWRVSSPAGVQRFINLQVGMMSIFFLVLPPAMATWSPDEDLLKQFVIRYFFESILAFLVWQESCLSSCLFTMWRAAMCLHLGA